MTLSASIVAEPSAAERLAPRWRELLARANVAEPTMTPLWQLTWWREFGDADGRRLRMIAVEDAGELVGLACLSLRTVVRKRVLPVRALELVASGEAVEDEICSDYIGVLSARGRERDVARKVADLIVDGSIGAWDALVMPSMDGTDPIVPELTRALSARGVRADATTTGASHFIPLPKTWDEYIKRLDGQNRYVVTRAVRELEKWAGKDYALVRASSPAELDEGRRILHSLHGERWEHKREGGVFASPRFTRFHDTVMRALLPGSEDGALDLLWLVAKGEPIAALYNIVYRGRVRFYQSGRKTTGDLPKALKPGIAIHALAIRRSIEQGHVEYDFLAGESQYKRQLSLESRPIVTLRAVAPTLRARALDRAAVLAQLAYDRARAWRDARHPKPSAP